MNEVEIKDAQLVSENEMIEQMTNREYKYGFETKIDMETAPRGLSEGSGPVSLYPG